MNAKQRKAARICVQFAHRLRDLGVHRGDFRLVREPLRRVLQGKKFLLVADDPDLVCTQCGKPKNVAGICRLPPRTIYEIYGL